MGRCFSLPDPDPATEDPNNSQPRQRGTTSVVKSLCQSIQDFFMKLEATTDINTKVSKAPRAEENLTRYRRSCSLADIEKYQEELTNAEEVDVANNENEKRATDLFQRWEMQLAEINLRNACVRRRLNEITLNLDRETSDPLDETETAPEEKLTNVEEVTTATRENKKGASALNQNESGGSEVDPSVVRRTETDDSAVDRKNEDPSSSEIQEIE